VIFNTRIVPKATVEAPLVFVGYGLTVPEKNYDDLAGTDLRGKVVVTLTGSPSEIPGSLASHYQTNAERWKAFRKAGADGCTVHVEVGGTDELIDQARSLGLRVGLAANPDTPFEDFEPFLDRVDLVLCMTVFPGFGGQSFMAEVMPKVAQVRAAVDTGALALDIEVDGGIDTNTAPMAASAGANVFVAGSAVFGAERPWDAAEAIRASVRRAVTS